MPVTEQRPPMDRRAADQLMTDALFMMRLSSRDRVFREDLLNSFEGLLRRRLRRYSACHDVGPRHAPDMLVLHLGISRIVDPERRHCRAEQTLRDVSHPMRVSGSSHHGSSFTIDRMDGMLRPRPVFRYSLVTFGCMRYLRKSLATSTFFAPFGIRPQRTGDLTRHRLAVVAERQAHRHDIPVVLLVVNDRDLGRDRAVEIHHDLFGMKGVVIVGVVPVDRARRHIAFLIGGGRIGQRLDRRFAHFGSSRCSLPSSRDDVLCRHWRSGNN